MGEMCDVVIVFMFVIGSKWISGGDRNWGGGGSRSEDSDSKSEISNQSVLCN